METNKKILVCIEEHPGISAKKIVSCMDSTASQPSVAEETAAKFSIYKQLRKLKRNGSVHNRGDRWYRLNRTE